MQELQNKIYGTSLSQLWDTWLSVKYIYKALWNNILYA